MSKELKLNSIQELKNKIIALRNEAHFNCKYEFKNAMNQVLNIIDDMQELPDFNPYRIDEERICKIYNKGEGNKSFLEAIQEYNSTLPTALVPLPKEMPAWFNDIDVDNEDYVIWEKIIQHYGTPEPKPSLPSVEELAKEVYDWFRSVPSGDDYTVFIAQHLHDKYSLRPREWWKGDIKGMKVKDFDGRIFVLTGKTLLSCEKHAGVTLVDPLLCTPYISPSAIEEAKEKLGEELFNKLMKEIGHVDK